MWFNWSIATINIMFQLIYIYIYIYMQGLSQGPKPKNMGYADLVSQKQKICRDWIGNLGFYELGDHPLDLIDKERKTHKVLLEKDILGFCQRRLILRYCSPNFVPSLASPFLFLFSSILQSLPFISTVHVQIQIDSVDTCPINPSLKSSGVVVRLKSMVQEVYRAFNAMIVAFSQIFSGIPLSCSFLILILFHGMVRCVALSGRSYPPSSVLPSR